MKHPHVEEEDDQEGFAARLLREGAVRQRSTKYRSTTHVASQTNLCERLFSDGRLVMSHLRSHMDPDSLELCLFLKANKDYWSEARIIDEIIAEERAKKVAAVAAAAAVQAHQINDDDEDMDA